MYKIGTGTRGRGHWDACVGTWDLETRDEGLGDIEYGTRGYVGQGRGMLNTGTRGTLMFIAKVRIKCDIYLFLLSSFFIYLESNAVILISGSRSVYLGEVSDFPEMTERTRLISYLLYGLYFMDPGLRSIKNGNWSADNLKKNTSP